MGTTRRDIVEGVLDTLGDLRVLSATRDGSDVTFFDDASLNGEPGAYTGREVLFVSGTADNIGEIRYVTGSANRAIGFGVSLPDSTATGDECWMVNTRGVGYRFHDVYRAINQSIRDVRERGPVPTSVDSSTYASGDSIAIPPEFVTVENLQWQDEHDESRWRVVPAARRPNGTGWWVDRFSRTVVVAGSWDESLDGRTVKLWGLAEPTELHDDDDETEVNSAWLVKAAAGIISRGRFMRSPTPETERTAASVTQEAWGLRSYTVTRRGPFSVTL